MCMCSVVPTHATGSGGGGEGGKQAGSAVLTLKVSLCYHAPAALTHLLPACFGSVISVFIHSFVCSGRWGRAVF